MASCNYELCQNGSCFNLIELLLERGANPNSFTKVALIIHPDADFKFKVQPTLLMATALIGHFELAKLLIENGAKVNKKTYGFTALALAFFHEHHEIVKLLLQNGADANTLNYDGKRVFSYACAINNIQMVKALLEHGAKLRVSWFLKNYSHKTKYAALSLFLLEHGMDGLKHISMFSDKLFLLISQRVYAIYEIRKAIKMTLFPEDTPVVAQIITEFVAGLNNLQRYIPEVQ